MGTTTLATLDGTDKQVAFAEDIRGQMLASLAEWREQESIPEILAEIDSAAALVRRQTSAAWLINTLRGIPATDLLERIGSYQRRGPQSKLAGFVAE